MDDFFLLNTVSLIWLHILIFDVLVISLPLLYVFLWAWLLFMFISPALLVNFLQAYTGSLNVIEYMASYVPAILYNNQVLANNMLAFI